MFYVPFRIAINFVTTSSVSSEIELKMDDHLDELHEKLVTEYMPVVIFIVILAILGVFGNALTAFFYGFKGNIKSSTTVFIISVSVLNLFASFSASATVADLLLNVKFSDVVLCKLLGFSMQVFMISTCLVMWMVSVDRYLKICRPKGVQFSERSAVVCVILLCLLGLLLASKSFATWGIVQRRKLFLNTTVNISDCSHVDRQDQKLLFFLLHLIDILGTMMTLATFAFTYSSIIRRLKKHSLTAKSKSSKIVAQERSGGRIARFFKISTYLNDCDYQEGKIKPNSNNRIKNSQEKLNAVLSAASRRSSLREKHIAILMFIGSLGLIVCYIPYIVLNGMLIADDDIRNMAPSPGLQLILRSPFLSIVIFPVLFSVFNSEFRRYVVSIFER